MEINKNIITDIEVNTKYFYNRIKIEDKVIDIFIEHFKNNKIIRGEPIFGQFFLGNYGPNTNDMENNSSTNATHEIINLNYIDEKLIAEVRILDTTKGKLLKDMI